MYLFIKEVIFGVMHENSKQYQTYITSTVFKKSWKSLATIMFFKRFTLFQQSVLYIFVENYEYIISKRMVLWDLKL